MERLSLLVYGDSLGMPRAVDGILFDQTYAELLRAGYERLLPETRVHLYNRSRGGGSAAALYRDYKQDSFYFAKPMADVLVIQGGVCDCAPRPIPFWLRRCISRLPELLKARIIKFIHNNRARLQRAGSWRETPPAEFKVRFQEWLEHAVCNVGQVYVINIAPTNDEIEAHSPGFRHSIELYNGLIQQAVEAVNATNLGLVDVHAHILTQMEPLDYYVNKKDGHHVTVAGHRLYSELILQKEALRLQTMGPQA